MSIEQQLSKLEQWVSEHGDYAGIRLVYETSEDDDSGGYYWAWRLHVGSYIGSSQGLEGLLDDAIEELIS